MQRCLSGSAIAEQLVSKPWRSFTFRFMRLHEWGVVFETRSRSVMRQFVKGGDKTD